jgi:hypothetical protein
MIGKDSGFIAFGYRCSRAMRDVGEESLADVLKADFE